MKYKEVSRKRRERLLMTGLSGGLNRRELPFAVADDQLTACCNLWWRDGVLRSRPALRAADVAGSDGRRLYAADGLMTRQTDEGVITGDVRPDGTVRWNTAVQAGTAGVRTPYDVSRLDGWDAEWGKSDGSLLFLSTGQVVAPLSTGGYQPLDALVYVPLAVKNGTPSADSTPPPMDIYEPLNRLTSAFRATYTVDGKGKYFYLPFEKRLSGEPIEATLKDADGFAVTHTIAAGQSAETTARSDGLRMRYSAVQHCLYFVGGETPAITAPPASGAPEAFSVSMHANHADTDARVIGGTRFGCWFGGESGGVYGGARLFVGGNPSCPNRIYWSDADRPLYFPVDNSMTVGDATQAVTAFGKQEDMLVIFKEREVYALTERTRTASGGPVSLAPLHSEIGCDCPATVQLCQNRLVWMTAEGAVYTLDSGNAYRQSNVRAVGDTIAPFLKQATAAQRTAASAGCFDGWYGLLVGRAMLLLDCRHAAFARTGGDPPWYRWEFDAAVFPERLLVRAGVPLLIDTAGRSYTFGGTADRVATYSGIREQEIPCSLCTKLLDFGYPDRRKTVRELAVSMGMPKGGRLSVAYITERGRRQDCREVTFTAADERAADFLRVVRLTPHAVRVRRLALELSVSGAAAFGSLVWRYDVENAGEKGDG